MPKVSLKVVPRGATVVVVRPAPVPVVSAKLAAMCQEREEVGAKFAQLEARKKELDAKILAQIVSRSGAENGSLDVDDYLVSAVQGSNSRLDKALLLKAGVKPTQIEKATVVTAYSYPRLTRKKAEASEE